MIISVTDKITLVGTSHISKKSTQDITKAVEDADADVVALELDQQRLHSLLSDKQQKVPFKIIKQVGATGFLFLTIGQFIQQKLAKKVGVKPGLEMRHAYLLAAQQKKKLLLIDQPIMVTMNNLRKKFVFKEKVRLFFDILTSPLQKSKLNINLEEVPPDEVLTTIITELKDRYPGLHEALIKDRDVYMTRALTKYSEKFPEEKIVAVVGAGHTKGMVPLFQELKSHKKDTNKKNN